MKSSFWTHGFNDALAGKIRIHAPETICDAEYNEGHDEATQQLHEAATALLDSVRDLLALHLNHHNHPTHVAARKLIAYIKR